MQSLCTLRNRCRPWPRNTRYQAGCYPLLGPDFHRLDRPSLRLAVAVGTLIAERPPHRSVLAAFPHTAPTSGVGRQSACRAKDEEFAALGGRGPFSCLFFSTLFLFRSSVLCFSCVALIFCGSLRRVSTRRQRLAISVRNVTSARELVGTA